MFMICFDLVLIHFSFCTEKVFSSNLPYSCCLFVPTSSQHFLKTLLIGDANSNLSSLQIFFQQLAPVTI